MKAALLTGVREMKTVDLPTPVVKADTDVLIRMESTGICGSDMHYYQEVNIGNAVVEYPFVIGHEGAGTVESVGPGVAGVRPGDRIALEPAVSCFACDQCRSGRPHTCRDMKFLGCPGQMGGCLAEYLVMPERCCYPIPVTMSFDQAVLAEPLAIGLYGVKLSGLKPGDTIGVLGAGPIGLSTILCARNYGAGRIYSVESVGYRARAAIASGADWAGNPFDEELVKTVLSREPGGLDIVFECCGKQEAVDQAVEMLKPGGALVIIGIPEFEEYIFPAHTMRRKELRIQNVRRQNGCAREAIDLIAAGTVAVDFMITHTFRLDEIQKAFHLVSRYEDQVIKGMIHYERI